MGSWATDRRALQITALGALVAVLVATGIWLVTDGGGRQITAYFTNTSALYPDNDVRVLGVPVGKVSAITPEGDRVRVDMTIEDDDVALPADVQAAIVSPSLVTGRYVQLTPVYTGGPLWDGQQPIPVERTAVPLGVDDLTRTATELSRALGPQGANQNGALNDLLNVGAQNLDGNGRALNDTIRNLGGLGATLNGSAPDLFGTITELQKLVATLRENDPGVRELNGKLADVTGFLASQRTELGGALHELSFALGDVAGFVKDNRATLKSNVDKLASVSQEVVDHQNALAEVSDLAPAALNNLANIYNGAAETLDTRANLNELSQPLPALLCQFAQSQLDSQQNLLRLPGLTEGCGNVMNLLGGVPNPLAPPGTAGGLPAPGGDAPTGQGLPLNPAPGTPLSSSADPAAPLQAPAPASSPAPGTAGPPTAPPTGPTREPGGGLLGNLFGGGS